jgi:ribosome-associated toxin RatA of RatAB toxin-antitoxin module
VIRIEEAVEIEAPADRAFAVVAQIGNYPTWLPGVLRAEMISDGGFRLVSGGPGGIEITALGRVVAMDPPRSLKVSAASPLFELVASCAIDSLGPNRCRVVVCAELEPLGLATLAAGIIASEMRAAAPVALARLRTAVGT